MWELRKIRKSVVKAISNFYWEIGVDLGSNNTLIYLKERGVVIDEPTMIARLRRKRWVGLGVRAVRAMKVIAHGTRAREMWNREPGQIEVVFPVKNGTISDLEAIEELVGYYLGLVAEVPGRFPKFLKPRVVVGVQSGMTDVQKRAVRAVFGTAGVAEATLVESAILAAVGIGMILDKGGAAMVVDIGAGKTEASVVSMGGVVVGKWIKTGGNDLDEAVINYTKIKYGVLVGRKSAERLKIELGGVVRGRDLETGLPKSIKMTLGEVEEAVALNMARIGKLAAEVLDETPAELMEEIIKRGIVLVGGGALMAGVDKLVEKETKITTMVADEPRLAVIRGMGELIERPELLERIKIINRL